MRHIDQIVRDPVSVTRLSNINPQSSPHLAGDAGLDVLRGDAGCRAVTVMLPWLHQSAYHAYDAVRIKQV
jgi:hypothetical protein